MIFFLCIQPSTSYFYDELTNVAQPGAVPHDTWITPRKYSMRAGEGMDAQAKGKKRKYSMPKAGKDEHAKKERLARTLQKGAKNAEKQGHVKDNTAQHTAQASCVIFGRSSRAAKS